MATINLDNLVSNLQDRATAKQGRIAASGNLAGMRVPLAALSHAWRPMSPGSHTERDPMSRPTPSATTLTGVAVKRAGRSAASRSGFPATSRTSSALFTVLPTNVRHDCLSNVCREPRPNGLAGHQPGRGMAPAYSSGK
jgi:hypothetical protein